MSSISDQIHARACEASFRYKLAEADLVVILQQAEQHRVFIERGHSSLFNYVTEELGIGENTTYDLIRVARKAREVPVLEARLRDGSLTLSNARRVASVLTAANQDEWLTRACTLTSKRLQKEIARVRPELETPERTTYVSADRVRLEVGISEQEMLKLRRAQDLLCQSRRREVSLEETIGVLTEEFLKRNDPVEQAKRHRVKNATPMKPSRAVGKLGSNREPIPAAALHAVNLRDQRRCTQVLQDGTRCNQSRWIEIHHKVPVAKGGSNSVDNLITLCSAHHKREHLLTVQKTR